MSTKGRTMSKKKGGGKKGAPKRDDHIVEDLDLDISMHFRDDDDAAAVAPDEVEEERIVQDKRRHRKQDILEVLPSEAHDTEDLRAGRFAPGERDEEEELAVRTARRQRAALAEDDFDAPPAVSSSKKEKAGKAQQSVFAGSEASRGEVIEKVERDFRAISADERLAMLQRESPEVIKMLTDFRTSMEQVKAISGSLHALLHGKKAPADQQHLVAFLETKVQLMLSYCMHITFYLLLKIEGRKVASHPVVDRLVELRVYMEKLWPLEQKLQYSLNQLLAGGVKTGGGKGAATVGASGNRARVGELRPVEESATKSLQKAAAASATKIEARRNLRKLREVEAVEAAEMEQMSRGRARKAPQLTMSVDEIHSGIGDGYHEREDQFFSKLVGGSDSEGDAAGASGSDGDDGSDDDGEALIDKLRARVGQKSKTFHGEGRAGRSDDKYNDDLGDDDGEDDDDEEFLSDADEEGEGNGDDDGLDGEDLFDELAAEDEEIRQNRAVAADGEAARAKGTKGVLEQEVDKKSRRQISKSIETHRGLTKARPKDRKTPRTAQRRKYEKGSRIAKTQSRSVHKEAPADYSGVANLKPHVTHSTRY